MAVEVAENTDEVGSEVNSKGEEKWTHILGSRAVCVHYISFYRHRHNLRFVSMFTRRMRRGINL